MLARNNSIKHEWRAVASHWWGGLLDLVCNQKRRTRCGQLFETVRSPLATEKATMTLGAGPVGRSQLNLAVRRNIQPYRSRFCVDYGACRTYLDQARASRADG